MIELTRGFPMQRAPFCLKALLIAAALPISFIASDAQAATPEIVQCIFGEGEEATDTTFLLPDARPASKAQNVSISVIPGPMEELPATAQLVPARKSPTNQDFTRIAFRFSEDLGFVVQVAKNGDGISFPVNVTAGQPMAESSFLGKCDNAAALFALWR